LFLLGIIQSYGQSDTTYYNYNDTCIATSVNQYDKLLRHIIPDKTEVTKQFKVDLLRLSLVQPNLSFETKLKNNITLEIEGILGESTYRKEGYYHHHKLLGVPIPDKGSLIYFALSGDTRFYHNINRRIRKGKNTNGFSGNYFSTGLTIKMAFYDTDIWHINSYGGLYTYPEIEKNKTMTSLGKMHATQSIGYFNLGYGIQRRIGNIGFWGTECKIGIGTNKHFETLYYAFELNARVGFAISSFKRKK
jgi:hypothetical protein